MGKLESKGFIFSTFYEFGWTGVPISFPILITSYFTNLFACSFCSLLFDNFIDNSFSLSPKHHLNIRFSVKKRILAVQHFQKFRFFSSWVKFKIKKIVYSSLLKKRDFCIQREEKSDVYGYFVLLCVSFQTNVNFSGCKKICVYNLKSVKTVFLPLGFG